MEPVVFLGVLAIILWAAATWLRKPKAATPSDPLDTVLLQWNGRDDFTRRHLLNGGVLTLGRPGAGKTTGSGQALGRAIVNDRQSTMLILAAKPEDAELWRKIYAAAGRGGDLLEFSPRGDLRCNMIEFIQRNGGDTREVVHFLTTAAEVLRTESRSAGGESAAFFEDEKVRMLHHAVELLSQAGVAVSAPNIQRFITTAALSGEQLSSDAWREEFHNQILRAAAARDKTPREQHDFELARDAWIREWPFAASRTRACVLSEMLNALFYFNSGIARPLISTSTNCSPLDMLKGGKSILVNCPACEWGQSGALVSTCWKYITQKAVLARRFEPSGLYNVIWADEAWQVCTSVDQYYAAQSRSHGGCMCYLVQGRDSFYSALKGENGRNFANALMALFHHRIFLALGSPDDAEWAASLLGKKRELSFGGSMQPGQDLFDEFMGFSRFSGSFNESWQPVLQPREFLNGMRCGGPAAGYLADAIIVRSGEPFASNGQNWIRASFSQR
jgi:hypothetical protein